MKERYTMGYDVAWTRHLQQRSAAQEAGFFLPYLHPKMSLLDCGCGPGTITAGLTETVAPGSVVGLDIGLDHLRLGRAHARERSFPNIYFVAGDAYDLPFAAGSFNAVFIHNVLSHLKNPSAVLKEIHRILHPGGIIGMSHPDYSGHLIAPSDPLLEQAHKLVWRLVEHNGGNPAIGKHQCALLHQAGFVHNQATASFKTEDTQEKVRFRTAFEARRFVASEIAEQFVELGWASRSELQKISEAWKTWGEEPGAFKAHAVVTVVGCKG